MLSQNNGNEYNTNIWWYRKIVLWIVYVFREYGIEVELVPEHYTSRECSECGEIHENGRIHRGLYVCRRTGRKVNADVSSALNMARRRGYKVKITRKIESYIVTHNGVRPLNPDWRANTQDPEIRNPALKRRGGVITSYSLRLLYYLFLSIHVYMVGF
jgi:putative transposase